MFQTHKQNQRKEFKNNDFLFLGVYFCVCLSVCVSEYESVFYYRQHLDATIEIGRPNTPGKKMVLLASTKYGVESAK